MTHSRIVLVTGARQMGKSTLCQRVAETLRAAEVTVSGLLTRRTGPHDLVVSEMHTGNIYPLTLPYQGAGDPATPAFCMDPAAMARSAAALESAFPTQVFFLDELGPLELRRGAGWSNALPLLHTAQYKLAILVIRPELLDVLIARLPAPPSAVFPVQPDNREQLFEALLQQASCFDCMK
ncbi:MAG TPA: DUF2478 domain-containing protein [Chloroflexi bacterium]|nr:DUF2478 domain-containing protein [Chloroflexota bacterium]